MRNLENREEELVQGGENMMGSLSFPAKIDAADYQEKVSHAKAAISCQGRSWAAAAPSGPAYLPAL